MSKARTSAADISRSHWSLRGCDSDAQANQWLVARSGGLEAIAGALRCWREYPMVQLCALLCMVPLALDNTVLQVSCTRLCSGIIAQWP